MTAKRPALGDQARRALRETVPPIRLVSDVADGSPTASAIRIASAGITADVGRPTLPLGVPAAFAQRHLVEREAARVQDLEREVLELRLRVRDLEHDLRLAELRLQEARESGARDERARNARSLGGRLPSILMPGGDR